MYEWLECPNGLFNSIFKFKEEQNRAIEEYNKKKEQELAMQEKNGMNKNSLSSYHERLSLLGESNPFNETP